MMYVLQVFVDKYRCRTLRYRRNKRVYAVPCNGQEGQFVKLVNTHNYLEIAEVQVYGESSVDINWEFLVFVLVEANDQMKQHPACTNC